MTKEDNKIRMKVRGAGKASIGILGFTPFGPVAGVFAMKAAFAGVVVGAAARLVAWPLGSKKLESFGRNLQDRSIKLGFTGVALTMGPFGGAALIAEGGYNVYKGDIAPYGFGAMSRKVSRFTSGVAQFGDHDYQPKFWMQEKHQKTTDIPPEGIDQTRQSSRPPVQAQAQRQTPRSSSPPAQPRQQASVKKEQEVEYTRVGDIVPRGKEYFATYVPAKYKDDPAKCPPAEMIVQKFDKDGNLISQGPGESQSTKIQQSYAKRESTSKRPSSLSSVGLASRTTSRDSIRSV